MPACRPSDRHRSSARLRSSRFERCDHRSEPLRVRTERRPEHERVRQRHDADRIGHHGGKSTSSRIGISSVAKTRTRGSARASFFRLANAVAQEPDEDRRGAVHDEHREEEPRHDNAATTRRREVRRRNQRAAPRDHRNDLMWSPSPIIIRTIGPMTTVGELAGRSRPTESRATIATGKISGNARRDVADGRDQYPHRDAVHLGCALIAIDRENHECSASFGDPLATRRSLAYAIRRRQREVMPRRQASALPVYRGRRSHRELRPVRLEREPLIPVAADRLLQLADPSLDGARASRRRDCGCVVISIGSRRHQPVAPCVRCARRTPDRSARAQPSPARTGRPGAVGLPNSVAGSVLIDARRTRSPWIATIAPSLHGRPADRVPARSLSC